MLCERNEMQVLGTTPTCTARKNEVSVDLCEVIQNTPTDVTPMQTHTHHPHSTTVRAALTIDRRTHGLAARRTLCDAEAKSQHVSCCPQYAIHSISYKRISHCKYLKGFFKFCNFISLWTFEETQMYLLTPKRFNVSVIFTFNRVPLT